MLSRVADALFWMARYFERAENTARLIDVNINMMLDMGHVLGEAGSSAPYWNPIIRITSPFDKFREQHSKTTQDSAIEWLSFNAANPNSILSCIGQARENARSVRGGISSEMWEQINTTYLQLRDTDMRTIRREGAYAYFRNVRQQSALFQGLVDTTMPREEGWHWVQIGRYLERADATSRLIDVKYYILLPSVDEVGGPIDNVQWISVLKSCSAYEAYQRRYVARITPARVAEFLVLDRSFPRSVRFCFDQMHSTLCGVAGEHAEAEDELAPQQAAAQVRAMLAGTNMAGIIQHGLHQYMTQLQHRCVDISEAITQAYFQGALRHVAQQ